MRKLTEEYKSPTSMDSGSNYLGETPDNKWLVLLGRSRDSELLTNVNWDVAIERLGGTDIINSEHVCIESFGHWACGWIEYLCVAEDAPKKIMEEAKEIEDSLRDYPVLDDERFSDAECELANRLWKEDYSPKERVEYIRENPDQFDHCNWRGLLQCVRGEYFGGWANELIG